MQFIDMVLNARVIEAELALKQAPSDEVVDACRQYISALQEFRRQLRELRGLSATAGDPRSALAGELLAQARSAVRGILEIAVRETNRAETLLKLFTSINVHEAAVILNVCKYMGSGNWMANSSGVGYANGFDTGQMSVEKAVQTASLLRREAYVVINKDADTSSVFATSIVPAA